MTQEWPALYLQFTPADTVIEQNDWSFFSHSPVFLDPSRRKVASAKKSSMYVYGSGKIIEESNYR